MKICLIFITIFCRLKTLDIISGWRHSGDSAGRGRSGDGRGPQARGRDAAVHEADPSVGGQGAPEVYHSGERSLSFLLFLVFPVHMDFTYFAYVLQVVGGVGQMGQLGPMGQMRAAGSSAQAGHTQVILSQVSALQRQPPQVQVRPPPPPTQPDQVPKPALMPS